ncbi:carboxypeptidase regulatory-like domain-containing protein [Reichenbachiella sp. MSK19-1]|uniref:carboxypeptidase regulatory-like domain-containing protein n=1 Tax=Reichenbachiella sp. MSK19-1 TaxID=1897631 RepID=UPI000E6B6C12|nr:carboxypeptidase regulatory-like domain-containing protein [Reichenbachiella sp. MSK19-1]
MKITLKTHFFLFLIIPMYLFSSCKEDTIDFKEKGSISGTVLQAGTGNPLEGVEITTVPSSSVLFTDSLGFFIFPEVETGNYSVRANLNNYNTEISSISVFSDSESSTTLTMSPVAGLLVSSANPTPADNQDKVNVEVQLNWQNMNDSTFVVSYDVEVLESNSSTPFLQISGLTDTLLVLENLKFSTQYFWQVSTKNKEGEIQYSEVWKFKTIPFPINQILYTSISSAGNQEVFSSDINGDSPTRLTYSSQNKYNPQYNSNRTKIAYIGNDGLENHIYTINNEGDKLTKVTSVPVASYHQNGRGYAWSPDNSKFVYCHYNKLYQINADGSNLTTLATAPADRHFRSVDWSESANKIVVETVGVNINDGEIYLMNTNGSSMTELIADQPGVLENPSFSIDGLQIVFTLDVAGHETLSGRKLNAQIVTVALSDPTEWTYHAVLKPNGTNDLYPRYSSDGSLFIFVNQKNDGSGTSKIYTLDVATGQDRVLLLDNATMPDWL